MAIDAVIFDWGGTLTPWKTSDGRAWWRIAARLVPADRVEQVGAALTAAEEEIWHRSRVEHRSGNLAEVFDAGGLTEHDLALAVHDEEWEWATLLDPDARPLLTGLRERGIRVGVLSNTVWTRARHEQIFVRDGIDHLIDGAVYTCEIPWTKPHPEAFRSAMAAVNMTDAHRCVFVGDRLFDDIYGARRAGMRAVLMPHSVIPEVQRGHAKGEPHAVIQRLTDLLPLVDDWRNWP
ncbi:MAG: putative hydrolase of the superfamily [Micromonosporaceae bacterium]|nr:putative hydrolase of the superfamily [Micromonosporaceae bacterium]